MTDWLEGLREEVSEDPDYSPEYQDEYQRLWHEAAAKAKRYREALEKIANWPEWYAQEGGYLDDLPTPEKVARRALD